MKKIKRRLLCLLLCVCLCFSLFVHTGAIEPLDGTINADDNATLIRPTLEMVASPTGAVAVGHYMGADNHERHYYRVNGNILASNDTTDGFVPQIDINAPDPGYSSNNVNDPDDRYLVSSTQYPFSCIGALLFTFPSDEDELLIGTAYMISPNVAATAAHNLYDSVTNEWANGIYFFPGAYGTSLTAPYGGVTPLEIVVSTQFYDSDSLDSEYDWGVMTFSSEGIFGNIGNSCGYLGIQFLNRSPVGVEVMISGYPSSLAYNQYACSGYTKASNQISSELSFAYTLDVTGGQSGAPILYYVDGNWKVVGHHRSSNNRRIEENGVLLYENYGQRYTSAVFSFLWAYKD